MASPARHVVALDTSCVIALVCGWHEHHVVTAAALEQRLDGGASLAIAAPALVEAYAVLTRLPAPWRVSPPDALQLLRGNFQKTARIMALTGRDYWSFLNGAPAAGVYGGRTYDAAIASCARKGRAKELLTLNARHFEAFGDESLRISSPL